MRRDAGALLIATAMVLHSPNVAAFICGTCARVAALLSSHTCAKPKPYSPFPPLPHSFLSVQVALSCPIAAHMAGALLDMAAVELLDGWHWSSDPGVS